MRTSAFYCHDESLQYCLNELSAADPTARYAGPIGRGAHTFRHESEFGRLVGGLTGRSMFIRHICPVADPIDGQGHQRAVPVDPEGRRLGGAYPEGSIKAPGVVSPWPGGEPTVACSEPFVSRSELKLREALAAFGMGGSLRARGDALDLGAAPGGWTKVLAEAGMRVAAVDPADLHPYVAGMDGVTHRREGYGAFLTRGMAFDLIACDMRLDPHESVAAMASFAGSLASGGVAVVTLKLPRRNAQGIAKACVARLSGAYMLIGARQLFYNRSEVTVALRKA